MKASLQRGLRGLLPAPGLSLLLGLCWLLLNQSASAGHVLLAVLLAVLVPWLTRRFNPEPARLRRGGVAARLMLRVLVGIVLGSVEVARRVLGPAHALQPCFVWVPLTLRTPHGLAALAGIITLTPGTVSCAFSSDHRHLLVLALHCTDAAALVADIKARYETPLLEILG